ncbi:unnamed protein product [Acanthoscelides obtectus]|uniref:Alpha-1,3-mannosyl-glycoprotein 2-beta-N-acetylglucosaminyltransferase n=1 Tax=Acanthoscelides obtectus TaxID=200917 RepID=A0A9P0JYD1_ACAOB|nr:unnamed protein product [Acanthoscelides obtectus]CAK1646121.1 Alpha-1,3-mannosyl-glycoprotein 2-beta-N-acetylglucosaminyltransferase [Acanthoscelides obtectus]
MRIKRTNLVVFLILLVWSAVLYVTISFKPIYHSDVSSSYNVDRQILKLEHGISEQFEKNKNIIKNAHKLLEIKKAGDVSKEKTLPKELQEVKLPILVFACNRITVSRCLDKLLKYRPDPDQFPIIVSQVTAFKRISSSIMDLATLLHIVSIDLIKDVRYINMKYLHILTNE